MCVVLIRKMVKLQCDRNRQFKITLPRQIALAKKWKKGDDLAFEIDSEGNLIIRKSGQETARKTRAERPESTEN